MLADEWHVGQVFWSLLWFTLFFIWIWLLIVVFADIFRSHDLGGFAKFLWVVFVIVLPYLGVFVYLIARGHKMSEHAEEAARTQDAAARGIHTRRGRCVYERGRRAQPSRRPQGTRRHRRSRVPAPQGERRRARRLSLRPCPRDVHKYEG